MADGLSRTIFQEDDCLADARIEHALDACKKDPRWVWKDGKDGPPPIRPNF